MNVFGFFKPRFRKLIQAIVISCPRPAESHYRRDAGDRDWKL